jgi:C-terminal AAA-associated domain
MLTSATSSTYADESVGEAPADVGLVAETPADSGLQPPRGVNGGPGQAGQFGDVAAHVVAGRVEALQATNDGTLREGFFLDLLRRGFTDDEARQQLDIAIDWGRYGELFEYDKESGELVLGSDPAKVRA